VKANTDTVYQIRLSEDEAKQLCAILSLVAKCPLAYDIQECIAPNGNYTYEANWDLDNGYILVSEVST
jgi:hypothetical protein